MSPRRRLPENEYLPLGLSVRILRGKRRFRYRYPDKRERFFPVGTTTEQAIAAAIKYNSQYRDSTRKVEDFLMPHDEMNKTMAEWIDIVIERVRQEEFVAGRLSKVVFSTFSRNAERMKQAVGDIKSKEFTLSHLNHFLDEFTHDKSAEVYNRYLMTSKKIFDYIKDEGGIENNLAMQKKKKPLEAKARKRLNLESFKRILQHAPHFLSIAMRLSIQTTHSVGEVCRMRYDDITWLDTPVQEGDLQIYGYLRIHRQKIKKKAASRVEVPITAALKAVIDDSHNDEIDSPYIVHQEKLTHRADQEHPTQVHQGVVSKAFSTIRDDLKLYRDDPLTKRPTFHEIRALAIHLFKEQHINPQQRAAHTNARTTEIYLKGHVEWNRVEAAEIKID